MEQKNIRVTIFFLCKYVFYLPYVQLYTIAFSFQVETSVCSLALIIIFGLTQRRQDVLVMLHVRLERFQLLSKISHLLC